MAKENKVNGNTQGIKAALLERLAALYELHQGEQFASHELVAELSELTAMMGREISVYIARDGRIADVSVGDSGKVNMPNMRLVRNEDRLCGVRCIHTHPNGDGRLSGVDLGTLRSMRLDSMASIGVSSEGNANILYAAYVGEIDEAGERNSLIYGPLRPYKLPQRLLMKEIYLADQRLKSTTVEAEGSRPERAILVGLESSEPYDTLEELKELAGTAGANVVGRFTQKRAPDTATYIGSGKAEELSLKGSELEADIFIFDDELTGIQARNLENILGARVIDRTALILDIFAQRATSREGKLQVELAQQKYRLPRLLGQGAVLSRLGGGIGTRGPGEKKLEIDKRRIRRRIFELEQELGEIEKQRGLRRAKRSGNPVPLVALVGYTNAGKSTLLNALTNAGVMAEDKLFATLDPVVRQVELPDGGKALLSDTVGFINKLPHHLVEAFRSTLEEAAGADLILHVIDRSSGYYESQMQVVEEVLSKLGAGDIPRINVYNKRDLISERTPAKGVFISAAKGDGLDELLEEISRQLSSRMTEVNILVPYDKYEAAALIRNDGQILSEEHLAEGVRIRARLEDTVMWKLKKILGGEYGQN